MAENEHQTLILTDANILIDYLDTDIEVLALASKYLSPIVVPDVVLQEVHSHRRQEIVEAGIIVIETPLSLLSSGAEVSRRLSTQDRVCLEMASANGWICATNDKVLRNACQARGVPLVWGLELMVGLVDRGVLPRRKARYVGRKRHKANPRSITDSVFRDFIFHRGDTTIGGVETWTKMMKETSSSQVQLLVRLLAYMQKEISPNFSQPSGL